MKVNISLLLCFFVAVYVIGCGRASSDTSTPVAGKASKIYSEAELDKLIIPGMSLADITNTFGPPGSVVRISERTMLLTYMYPLNLRPKQGPYMSGYGIDIQDGRVVRWSPVTGMSGNQLPGGGSRSSLGERTFEMLVATNFLTNLVNAVDVAGSAEAANMQGHSALKFKAKVFAGRNGNERPDEQTVILALSDQDASQFKDLTEKNFGKRLLIICHNKAIAAPTVSAPIGSRQFTFIVKTGVLDALPIQ